MLLPCQAPPSTPFHLAHRICETPVLIKLTILRELQIHWQLLEITECVPLGQLPRGHALSATVRPSRVLLLPGLFHRVLPDTHCGDAAFRGHPWCDPLATTICPQLSFPEG